MDGETMDNKDFDQIVKGKIQDYSDPVFDESALAGLHGRLATAVVAPWYVQYQTLIGVTSALVLFTLINFWISRNQVRENYDDLLLQMKTLQTEFTNSKQPGSIQEARLIDTVYIVREIASPTQSSTSQVTASTNPYYAAEESMGNGLSSPSSAAASSLPSFISTANSASRHSSELYSPRPKFSSPR